MTSLKICLVSPYSSGKGKIIPNGIRTLAGIAHESNPSREIRVYDGNFESMPCIEKKVKEFNPDILGVSVFTDNFKDAKNILNSTKTPIKLSGGPYATKFPKKLQNYSEYVFLGEAETTFKQFLDKIENNQKEEKTILPSTESFVELETIPISGWKFLADYIPQMEVSPMWHLKSDLVNILSSRGCNNNCVFCLSSQIHGKDIRFRSVENIEEEINFVNYTLSSKNLPSLKSVIFDDSDIFFRDNQSLEDMFLMLNKYGLTYSAFASIENADKEIIALGQHTGLKSLFFGIETHEKNRKYIGRGKKFSDEQAEDLLIHCKRNNIFTCLGFIVGYPWESHEDMIKTMDCMNELPGDYPGVGILDLHPGTAVWEYKQKHIDTYKRTYGNLADNDFLCSPHPTIRRNELEKLVSESYKKAYTNPKRISRLNFLKDSFDKTKMQEVFKKKKEIYS